MTTHEVDAPLSGKEDDHVRCLIQEFASDLLASLTQNSDTTLAALMDYYLEAPVLGHRARKGTTGVLAHVHREISSEAGLSVKKCLLDPNTPVSVLAEIKNAYQAMEKQCPRDADQRVATVIYFAAIASALAHHGQKITSYSRDELRAAIGKLLGKSWVDSDIKGLFEEATKALRK